MRSITSHVASRRAYLPYPAGGWESDTELAENDLTIASESEDLGGTGLVSGRALAAGKECGFTVCKVGV